MPRNLWSRACCGHSLLPIFERLIEGELKANTDHLNIDSHHATGLYVLQQRPAEMEWYSPRCIGDIPNKRSGHTFTIVKGGIGYIFGGEHSLPVNRRQEVRPASGVHRASQLC